MAERIQQIQKRMLVSLAQVAKNIGLREGDHVLIEERDGGIFIRPVRWHDKRQEYFWTKEWQDKMDRSLKALQEGRYKVFHSSEDLLRSLGEEAQNADDNSN